MIRVTPMALALALAACGSKPEAEAEPSSPAADADVMHAAEDTHDGGPAGNGNTTGNGAGELTAKCRRFTEERRAFFGDLHVHTALSLDANLQGTRLRPRDAYRFAKGERVGLPPYDEGGQPRRTLQIERPLDFVALSDHAEFLGLVTTCVNEDFPGYDSPACREFRNHPDLAFIRLNARLGVIQSKAGHVPPCTRQNGFCGAATLSTWQETQRAAHEAQDATDACTFTSFVAYEWSASPKTANLHRNVIFRNEIVPELPFSYFDGAQEQDLWDALDRDCSDAGTGCEVLTIPHNSNLSTGLMFEAVDRDGKAIDRAYAARRARFEPLVEIIQHKGSSECVPALGADEECNFELLHYDTLASVTLGTRRAVPTAANFVRDALGQGLLLGRELGANPFAYGFVGSTDTHVGTPGAVSEATFAGHGGAGSSAGDRVVEELADHPWLNPGGLTGLWAEENSREALFRAMRRREAFATSGTRIVLRLFGGADLDPGMCGSSDFVKRGYAAGVPMGGELKVEGNAKPSFAVWALKDAGAPAGEGMLERIEIIKGTLEGGEPVYRVIDVAHSPDRPQVDEASCKPDGRGAAELCGVFTDEDYKAGEPAFYYARVLEAPSCRWQARACLAQGVDCGDPDSVTDGFKGCCDEDIPKIVRERAWSSPIFVGSR